MNAVIYHGWKQKHTMDENFVNSKSENNAGPDLVWLTGDPGSAETIIKNREDPVDMSWRQIGFTLQRQPAW